MPEVPPDISDMSQGADPKEIEEACRRSPLSEALVLVGVVEDNNLRTTLPVHTASLSGGWDFCSSS